MQLSLFDYARQIAQDAYDAGRPIMTDAQFDACFDENSGTLGTRGDTSHAVPMLSLQKCRTAHALAAFVARMTDAGERLFWSSLKVDGFAVSLIYDGGRLMQATTRGDGHAGEDITAAVRAYVSLPASIPTIERVEIRGEIAMRAADAQPGENPRSVAVGMCQRRRITPDARRLSFYAYDMMAAADDLGKLPRLAELGFSVVPHVVHAADGLADAVRSLDELRAAFPCQCDGIVCRCASQAVQAAVGRTAHHPRYAMAYKYACETAETIIDEVIIQTGETGKVTPIAVVRPVFLDGATIRRVSLHTIDTYAAMDLKPGTRVIITRAGGTTPQILCKA